MKFNVQIAFLIVLISEFIFYAETKSKLRLKLENQKYSNHKGKWVFSKFWSYFYVFRGTFGIFEIGGFRGHF